MRRSAIWLSTFAVFSLPCSTHAQIISITIAPPELPVYVQPPIPEPGYLWTPGYWAYGLDGYFWVPGTWVRPPAVGLLWTPGYWGWRDGIYAWSDGYWGSHVGFYGGVSYGYGYGGVGYAGGTWRGGVLSYNSTVNNFGGVHVTSYNKTVVNTTNVTNVSFNGGAGGINATPNAQERVAAAETHTPPTPNQTQHQTAAATNRSLLASVNHGAPSVAATSKPGEFTGKGVVAARSAAPGKPANGPVNGPGQAGKGAINAAAPSNTRPDKGAPSNTRADRGTPSNNTRADKGTVTPPGGNSLVKPNSPNAAVNQVHGNAEAGKPPSPGAGASAGPNALVHNPAGPTPVPHPEGAVHAVPHPAGGGYPVVAHAPPRPPGAKVAPKKPHA